MQYSRTRLHSLELVLPEQKLSSADIETELSETYQRLKLPEGRLELMTGIRERRLWPEGTKASEASAMAGAKVLEKSGFNREYIGVLIHSAVCRDFLEPATASVVHDKLGLCGHTLSIDVSNACLGFLNSMSLVAAMIDSGQIRAAMIVSGENGRPLLEHTIAALKDPALTRQSIKPHFASLTIGCGAAAAILCDESLAPEKPKIISSAARIASEHSKLCSGDVAGADQLAMATDSEALLNAGVALAEETWADFEKTSGWDKHTPDRFICHQVGSIHRRAMYERLALDEAKDVSTFETMGNMGSVSLPATLAMAIERGEVSTGDRLALLGIGSGVQCQMMAVEW